MVWEPVLDLFRESIETQGYYYWNGTFPEFKKQYGLKAPRSTPEYLSIDFWSRQRKELTQHGWYILRVGKGSFAVFSEAEFPRPYTKLQINNAENLEPTSSTKIPQLNDAFRLMMENKASAEDSILELLRFHGVYGSLINATADSSEFYVGPRGNFKSSFDMSLRYKNKDAVDFQYDGQIELDYSLWSEDKVFLIEAKSRQRGGMDIGWHKLVFPTQHFKDITQEYGIQIIPVYLLRKYSRVQDHVYFFVFSPIGYHDGLILNDQSLMEPESVYSVDLNALMGSGQQQLRPYSRK
jgi:hypothetical protein